MPLLLLLLSPFFLKLATYIAKNTKTANSSQQINYNDTENRKVYTLKTSSQKLQNS